jgi:membrane protease YdiL (CAAX protease family)
MIRSFRRRGLKRLYARGDRSGIRPDLLDTTRTRPAPPKKSFSLFVCLCAVAYGFALAGVMFFPNQLPGALMARAMLAACGVALLLFGSKMLLRRDGFPADALGLQLTRPHAKGFVLGVAGGLLFIALMAATLAVQVPVHWERGSLSLSHAAFAAHTYFWTGFGEELIFRGYALVALSCYLGPRKAVWALALPFGLFHLPGMGMGMAAAKMIATTSAMSIVFSYSFLFTGTLWTAVGLHVVMNVSLHTLTGLDGADKPTLWKPIFGLWPTGYDAGFWTLITITSLVAFFLSRKIDPRFFTRNPESRPHGAGD